MGVSNVDEVLCLYALIRYGGSRYVGYRFSCRNVHNSEPGRAFEQGYVYLILARHSNSKTCLRKMLPIIGYCLT